MTIEEQPVTTQPSVTGALDSLSWRVGGPQGSGVDTAARIFAGACAAGGLHIFGRREYYSNIKGRHSYYDVRVSDHPMCCHRSLAHVLTTFEEETLARHAISTVEGGAIVCDTASADVALDRISFLDERLRQGLVTYLEARDLPPTTAGLLEDARARGVHVFVVSYDDIIDALVDDGLERTRAQRTLNTIAVAESCALLGYEQAHLAEALAWVFRGRQAIVDMNIRAVELAYEYTRDHLDVDGFHLRLRPTGEETGLLLVGGAEASAMGKMAAGLTFQTYYPISPATDESSFLESHANVPLRDGGEGAIVVVQTEDELAAITMASGAALTGARSATATSGPGFSLMVEALGWAGINEVPLVVTLYQRGGPSTGLPTRTEQGDLLFAINAGHGEFPRLVLASGSVTEAFYDAAQAFSYAERYQTPVIHLLDQTIARSTETVEPFDLDRIHIERGELYQPGPEPDPGPYPRFALTKSGISPRPLLGQPGGQHWLTGAEHTQFGQVTEDPGVREEQLEKRQRKLVLAAREIPLEEKVQVYGDARAALTFLSWGSSQGAILEAIEGLAAAGQGVRYVHVRLLWPFPATEVERLLEGAQPLIVVEENYSGQFAQLLRAQTGLYPDYLILKYNGRPMTCGELHRALHEIRSGTAGHRIVLRNPYE
ncbi:MAG: 2-oxoacid:acceptor oxidoreductase subunit alpha [Anaerolineae bacterium]